jgi:hypothetical protein
MDENVVRAIGAILSRRSKDDLNSVFLGFAIARAFSVEEGGAKDIFDSGVIAADRELQLLPNHDVNAVEEITRYAKMIVEGAAEYIKARRLSRTLHEVADAFGPDAALDLARMAGAVVMKTGEDGSIEAVKARRDKCSSCAEDKCPVHPSNSDDDNHNKLVH